MKKMTADFLVLAAVVFASVGAFPSLSSCMRPDTLYVGPHGSDLHWGGDSRYPLATIQFASKVVPPGGTVVILPGTYRERPRIRRGGATGYPTTFRAEKAGTVILSGAVKGNFAASVTWTSESEGVFSTRPGRPIYWLTADGGNLFRCHSLKEFLTLARRPDQMGAFFSDEDRLLRVILPDRRSPAEHELRTHGKVFPQGVWRTFQTANLWMEADHVSLEGLRFEFGVGAGVRLWRASDVRIKECLFTGAAIGVAAMNGLKPSVDLSVENCLYHNYPQAEWRRHWLSWADVYSSYSSNGLVEANGHGSRIVGNLVVHGGDGLRANSGRSPGPARIELAENLVTNCTDDAFEIEGPAKGICLRKNIVFDCHESLGLSPVLAGPVTVAGNLFLHPANGLNGAQVKLLGTREPDLRLHPIRNIRIDRNVFVGNWLCWYSHPVVDVIVKNNLFAVRHRKEHPWPKGVIEDGNQYIILSERYPHPLKNEFWLKVPSGGGSTETGDTCPAPEGGPFRIARPGPRWLDWHSLPATCRLADAIPDSLFKS